MMVRTPSEWSSVIIADPAGRSNVSIRSADALFGELAHNSVIPGGRDRLDCGSLPGERISAVPGLFPRGELAGSPASDIRGIAGS
jgi:hypothetical protein